MSYSRCVRLCLSSLSPSLTLSFSLNHCINLCLCMCQVMFSWNIRNCMCDIVKLVLLIFKKSLGHTDSKCCFFLWEGNIKLKWSTSICMYFMNLSIAMLQNHYKPGQNNKILNREKKIWFTVMIWNLWSGYSSSANVSCVWEPPGLLWTVLWLPVHDWWASIRFVWLALGTVAQTAK